MSREPESRQSGKPMSPAKHTLVPRHITSPADSPGAEPHAAPKAGIDARLDALWESVRQADARPDDLTRARMLAGLEAALDDAEERMAPAPRSRSPWFLGAAAFATVAAAAAAIFMIATSLRTSHTASVQPAAQQDPGLRIVPYLFEGNTHYPLGKPVEVVSLAPGMRLRARIGQDTDATLRGPATLELVEATAERTLLRLTTGTLVLAHEPAAAATAARPVLVIETPDAVTTLADTLLAIEATGEQPTRVSVARGSAVVDHPGHERRVLAAQQSWHVGAAQPAPLAGPVVLWLSEHDTDVRAPTGQSGMLRIEGAPAGAEAWLGEQRLGTTPLVAQVAAGALLVRIAAEAHQTTELSTVVRTGQVSSVAHRLTPLAPAAPDSAPDPAATSAASSPPDSPVGTALPRPVPGAKLQAAPEPAPSSAVLPATAETVYAEAEAAIARGDRAGARAVLLRLIQRYPDDPIVDAALYELARLAFTAGALDEARLYLERVITRDRDPVFLEPAEHLRCRVEVAAGPSSDAISCLTAFRKRFPRSPHDAEALALLASLHHAQDNCAVAGPLLDEYLRRYPRGRFAAEAATRLERCQSAASGSR